MFELIVLKIYAKFEGKLTCAFKNEMKNLANFGSQLQKQRFHLRK